LQLPSDPKKVIRAIVTGIKKMISEHDDCSFEGIGLTVPGRFSHQLKKTVFAPNIAWPIAQIKSRVEEATGLPVVVDNVANACVLSEVWFGKTDENRDIVLVNVSEGIGTGIFVNGGLVRGAGEMAGEFGHVQIDREGISCGCGSRGCWETLASNRAGLRYYKEFTGRSLPSIDALLDLAEKNDADAIEAITRMCRALGHGLHMVVTTLAPSEIVLVGEFTRAWSRAHSIIRDELRKFPFPALPKLRMSTEPGTARLRGGVALAMSEKLL
jgi:predicted NBD/HSP70 family sugar kinase